MTDFQDLKSKWDQQPEVEIPSNGIEVILKKINTLKYKQRISNVVLLTTVLILTGFFFYINAYSNTLVTFALLLMIGSLLIRVFLEYLSIKKLKQLDVTKSASTFNSNMVEYYQRRIKIHYIISPIIMLLYITGFIILLPFFKANLSSGFYTYIVVSSVFILVIMSFFIGKQIQKELRILKQLQH